VAVIQHLKTINMSETLSIEYSVSQPVCREILPSVPPKYFRPYFFYSYVENEEILVAISEIKQFFQGLFPKKLIKVCL